MFAERAAVLTIAFGLTATPAVAAPALSAAEATNPVVYDAAVAATAGARLARVRLALAERPGDAFLRAEELRVLYFLAIEDEVWLPEAEAAARAFGDGAGSDAARAVSAEAYLGALETLRAKHAFWPQRKLRHLDDGLAILGAAIDRDPTHVEARYLRLMSCYWLPGLLGKRALVREDFAALARLLPNGPGDLPTDLWANTVRFVLEHAPDLEPQAVDRLQEALARWSKERAS